MSSNSKLVSLLIMLPMATWLAGAVAAEPEDVIQYRQAVMKSVGGHMAAIAQIVRGKVDYPDDLLYHAESIAYSMKSAGALFPEDSDFGDTRALVEIWEQPAEFNQVLEDAGVASDAFLQAVKSGDQAALGTKFENLGDACKACHKDFREEE